MKHLITLSGFYGLLRQISNHLLQRYQLFPCHQVLLELNWIRLVVEAGYLEEFEFVKLVSRVRYALLVDRENTLLGRASNIAHILVIEAGPVIKFAEQ